MKRRMTECAIKLALTALLALAIPAFQGYMDHANGNDGDSAAAEGAEPDAQKKAGQALARVEGDRYPAPAGPGFDR